MSRYPKLSKDVRNLLLASTATAALFTSQYGIYAFDNVRHGSYETTSSSTYQRVQLVEHETVRGRLSNFFGRSKNAIKSVVKPERKAEVRQPVDVNAEPRVRRETKKQQNLFDRLVGKLKGGSNIPKGPPQDPGMRYPTTSSPAQAGSLPSIIPGEPNLNLPPLVDVRPEPPKMAPLFPPSAKESDQPRLFPSESSPSPLTASNTQQVEAKIPGMAPPPPFEPELQELDQELPPIPPIASQPEAKSVAVKTPASQPKVASRPTDEQMEAFEKALEAGKSRPKFSPPIVQSGSLPVLDLEELVADANKAEASMSVTVVKPEAEPDESEVPAMAPLIDELDIPPMPELAFEEPEEKIEESTSSAESSDLNDFFQEDTSIADVPVPNPVAFDEQRPAGSTPPQVAVLPKQEDSPSSTPAWAATDPSPQVVEEIEPHTGLSLEEDLFASLPLPPLPEDETELVASAQQTREVQQAPGFVRLESTADLQPTASVPTITPAEPPSLPPLVAPPEPAAIDDTPVGIKGFCPVALRDQRELLSGDEIFTASFNETKYKFSSIQALEKFQVSPEKYAPADRGRDVIHFALTGEEVTGSLDHAVWYKGRLYLFTSAETMETFMAAPVRHATNR